MSTRSTSFANEGTMTTISPLTTSVSSDSPFDVMTPSSTSGDSLMIGEDDLAAQIPAYHEMRVVAWQTAAGLKPPSGGFRGNYATLHSLSKHGHKTMQLVWAYESEISEALTELKQHGKYDERAWEEGQVDMLNTALETVSVKYWKFTDIHGVKAVALDAVAMLATLPNEHQQHDGAIYIETGEIPARSVPYITWVSDSMTEFEPTHILFNDALASKVTAEMDICKEGKTYRVEIVHSAEQFPLGSFAGGVPGSSKTTAEVPLWHNLDGIVSVSLALQDYIKETGFETSYIANHVWCYKDANTGNWPQKRSNFHKQTVVMVNPAPVKGFPIFLAMAKENSRRTEFNRVTSDINERLPEYRFIVYLGWGANSQIEEELRAVGVDVRPSAVDMEPAFNDTSILIVPSLWFEAWGIVATEAQLRGIPVIASKVGGLPEAKRGVNPLIEVNAIDGKARNSEGVYVIPEQDVTPWIKTLDEIMGNEEKYKEVADDSFITTQQWCREFDERAMEKFLLAMKK